MAIIKCKMCGGDMELSADMTFGACEYCGTTMTLPKISDEQRAAIFNRGNHFRRAGDFDKALEIYETIVQEDPSDAEAHWCCALCRFGIEYVEDPASLEYYPTCHRASFDSFLQDVDYLAALEASEGITKRQYQKDAAKIYEVQRKILAASQSSEPFDIFLCYKETDDDTHERTQDSVDVQELYYRLTQEGYRVFFSRITLEDKAGTEYEPYIFAALNSAKVMVAVGSKPEYLDAAWVKNEWSRFLSLMKKDRSKILLPCYKNMSPYEMPEQLSILQAYDMTKIGFMQDLLSAIKKAISGSTPGKSAKKVIVQTNGVNSAALIKRAFLFLEDGNWQEAFHISDQVLDREPRSAQAYLVRLMAEVHARTQDDLANCPQPFDYLDSCKKASRFDPSLAKKLFACNRSIAYRNARTAMAQAGTKAAFEAAAKRFRSLSGYEDAEALERECLNQAELSGKEEAYAAARRLEQAGTSESLTRAIGIYESIPGWKDADARAEDCRKKQQAASDQEASAAAEQAEKKRRKRLALIFASGAAVLAAAAIVLTIFLFVPLNKYKKAAALRDSGNYPEAISAFTALGNFKDSPAQVTACQAALTEQNYQDALSMKESGDYENAIAAFEALGEYQDSADQIVDCMYLSAVACKNAGDYEKAAESFSSLRGYKDASDQQIECRFLAADALEQAGQYGAAAIAFSQLGLYNGADERCRAAWRKSGAQQVIASAEESTVILRPNGTVTALGGNRHGQSNTGGWTDIIAVSAGDYHTVGVKEDGSVISTEFTNTGMGIDWGQADVRQSEWENVVAVSAGPQHTVALRQNGTVVACGREGSACLVKGWTDIIAVGAGLGFTVGLQKDGTVISTSNFDFTGWTDIVAIYAGTDHVVGVKKDGTVLAVGPNDHGECAVSGWTDIVAVSAGSEYTVGLKKDGTVVACGDNSCGQCNVSGWTNIVAIAAGGYYDGRHTVGLKADGTLVACGDSKDGKCDLAPFSGVILSSMN